MKQRNQLHTLTRQAGMTLLEIIIVMALLTGIIVAIFSFVGGQADQADIDVTSQKQAALNSQFMIWKRKNRSKSCPSNVSEIATGKSKDKTEQITDSWGQEMKTECAGGKVTIVSAGPDKKFGTEDDVKSEFK